MNNVFDNFSIGSPNAIGQSFQSAFEAGQEKRKEHELNGVLSAYAVNPDDPGAVAKVAKYDPKLAISIGQDQRERQKATKKYNDEAHKQDLQRRAAAGDTGALAELAGVDLDAWKTLGEVDRKSVKDRVDYIGQAALQIKTLPPEQRGAAWDAAIEQAVQNGHPDLAQYKGHYSEQALDGAIYNAGLVDKLHSLTEPKYMAPPQGAGLVNVRDPASIKQYNDMIARDISGQGAAIPDGWEVEGDGSGNATGGFQGQ